MLYIFPILKSPLLILVHLLPEMELRSPGGDLVMFPGNDESLREDSRTNWRMQVRCSLQVAGVIRTQLEMISGEITITLTLTRGRIMTEFILNHLVLDPIKIAFQLWIICYE